jgi:hypothetical protein
MVASQMALALIGYCKNIKISIVSPALVFLNLVVCFVKHLLSTFFFTLFSGLYIHVDIFCRIFKCYLPLIIPDMKPV